MKSYNQEFIFDEESKDVVRRYEQAVKSRTVGYFDVEELEVIVDYYLNCGKPKESFKAIDLGMTLHPGSSVLQTKRAKVYLASGEVRKALHVLERIQNPNDVESLLLKGEALLRLNSESDALLIFSELLAGNQSEAAYISADIAHIYISNGYFQNALSYLENAITAEPKDADLLLDAAFCFEQTDRPEMALDYYNRIIDIDAYSIEAWFNMGLVHFGQNNYQKALEAFDFVTVIDEEDSGGWLQKGNTLFHLNRFEESLDCYRHCEGKVAYPDLLLIFMGECYEKLETFADARDCYQKSLDINDQNPDAWTGMGICCLELNLPELSIGYLQRSLDLDSENFETWVYLAEAYVNTSKDKDAEAAYKRSLKLEQHQPDTWVALGNIYVDTTLYQQALDCYMEAYNQDSTLENIHLFLAIAYYKLNDLQKAIPLLQKALQQNPGASSVFLDICPEAKDLLINL